MTWQSIATAPRDGRVIAVRWRFTSEHRWREARASYRTEPKAALVDPLTGTCYLKAQELSGWMYEDQPYLIPGVVEWHE